MMTNTGKKHHGLRQIAEILQAANKRIDAGHTVAQTCDALDISPATYYYWNKSYGGMTAYQLKQLQNLVKTSTQLGQQVRQLAMDNAILWEALWIAGSLTSPSKRDIAKLVREKLDLSERRIYAALTESRRRQWDKIQS